MLVGKHMHERSGWVTIPDWVRDEIHGPEPVEIDDEGGADLPSGPLDVINYGMLAGMCVVIPYIVWTTFR